MNSEIVAGKPEPVRRTCPRATGMNRYDEFLPDLLKPVQVMAEVESEILRQVSDSEEHEVDPVNFGDLAGVRNALPRLNEGNDQDVVVGLGIVLVP